MRGKSRLMTEEARHREIEERPQVLQRVLHRRSRQRQPMMFVSFPGVVGGDGTPLIAWAGLDHLQLAEAIGDFYGLVQTELGGSDDPRLVPLLAALHELIPWIA